MKPNLVVALMTIAYAPGELRAATISVEGRIPSTFEVGGAAEAGRGVRLAAPSLSTSLRLASPAVPGPNNPVPAPRAGFAAPKIVPGGPQDSLRPIVARIQTLERTLEARGDDGGMIPFASLIRDVAAIGEKVIVNAIKDHRGVVESILRAALTPEEFSKVQVVEWAAMPRAAAAGEPAAPAPAIPVAQAAGDRPGEFFDGGIPAAASPAPIQASKAQELRRWHGMVDGEFDKVATVGGKDILQVVEWASEVPGVREDPRAASDLRSWQAALKDKDGRLRSAVAVSYSRIKTLLGYIEQGPQPTLPETIPNDEVLKAFQRERSYDDTLSFRLDPEEEIPPSELPSPGAASGYVFQFREIGGRPSEIHVYRIALKNGLSLYAATWANGEKSGLGLFADDFNKGREIARFARVKGGGGMWSTRNAVVELPPTAENDRKQDLKDWHARVDRLSDPILPLPVSRVKKLLEYVAEVRGAGTNAVIQQDLRDWYGAIQGRSDDDAVSAGASRVRTLLGYIENGAPAREPNGNDKSRWGVETRRTPERGSAAGEFEKAWQTRFSLTTRSSAQELLSLRRNRDIKSLLWGFGNVDRVTPAFFKLETFFRAGPFWVRRPVYAIFVKNYEPDGTGAVWLFNGRGDMLLASWVFTGGETAFLWLAPGTLL